MDREFDLACDEYYRTGKKPDWLVVTHGPYGTFRLNDGRYSKEELEERNRRGKKVTSLSLRFPEFLCSVCSNWVMLGYCNIRCCGLQHPAEYQASDDLDALDNLWDALHRYIEKNGFPILPSAPEEDGAKRI